LLARRPLGLGEGLQLHDHRLASRTARL
jgi:hypothetical protein